MNTDYPKDPIEKPKNRRPRGEHYPGPDGGQPALHVLEDGDYQVWLNTGTAAFDGLCIGTGASRQEAIADAVRVLEWATEELQGPPPALR